MPNETLEERKLKVLEKYVDYARTRDSSRFVQDDDAMSAARLLGESKSKLAVPLLVQCILVTNSYDAGVTFRKALQAIGWPALASIESALSNSGFGGFRLAPGGPERTHLMAAKDNILSAMHSEK